MYPGQQARMIPVSPDRIPVFVRAGAVLPVDETYSQADNGRMDSLFLHIFPDADGKASGKVYLDDGHTPQPGPAGAYRLIHIETSRKGDQHLLALETSGNGYPDEPNQYVLTLIWHEMDSPPASLRWNGTTLPVTAVVFEPTTRIIRLQITAYPGRKGRLILTQISPNK
jgi:hypothetical protein